MKLIRANINDCEKIWKMQKEAFADLLEKYQDYETSPANEPVEKIKAKLQNGEAGEGGDGDFDLPDSDEFDLSALGIED